MSDVKLPDGVKKVDMPDSSLSNDKQRQIFNNFMKRVSSPEKRSRIVRLANAMSDNEGYTDEFFAALEYYSRIENDTRMERDFEKYARGGPAGLNYEAPAEKPEPKAAPKRSRRGKET